MGCYEKLTFRKKIMKSLKTLFSVLLLCAVFSSCTSDDTTLATIKYQVAGLDSYITKIKYNGSTSEVTVTDPNKFANGSDTKKVPTSFLPFQAKIAVDVNNTTASAKHYTLVIYVNGVAKDSYDFDVPANSMASSGNVIYTVLAE